MAFSMPGDVFGDIEMLYSEADTTLEASSAEDTSDAQNSGDESEQEGPENSDDPDQKIQSVTPVDSTYSPLTHKLYHNQFKLFENRPDSSEQWDNLLGVSEWKSVDLYKNLKDDIQVLGWHPYWAEDASLMYDYETLSIISYFGYTFNPDDGSGINKGRWLSTRVMERAHKIKKSVKLLLTVYSYDSTDNAKFFSNPDAMIRLVDDVTKLVDEKEAHGITLDFQNISPADSINYVTLVQQFSEQMAPKEQLVTIVVPAVDPESAFAVGQMAELVDYVIVMGYDFHGTGNEDGPFSILYDIPKGKKSSIENSVNRLRVEKAVPPEKILVSLGWVGSLHQEHNGQHEHLGYRSYGYMRKALSDSGLTDGSGGPLTIVDEKGSRSNKVTYQIRNSEAVRTYYFSDTTNFGLKLDWIQKDSLGGAAIWTLADAGNGDAYWSVIAENYGRPPWWIVNNIINPTRDFLKDEWLNPFLSLFLSIVIILSYLIILSMVIYRKNVPDWLQQVGVFLPLIITTIMVISLSHDLIAHYGVDRDDDPWLTGTSISSGTLVLVISLWYCYRVYYLDRKRVP